MTHHTSSFLLLLFGPFSPVVWLIPLYILCTMFGHIYFTVVFHLSPVVRGPACSFINIISGSHDHTIRIWDAKTGAAVGHPLEGHTAWVSSVAYSPDGRHIISGSGDRTIRIWDAESGAAIGNPLEGHTACLSSVAYSSNGRHITSEPDNSTTRTWDAEAGTATGKPLEGYTHSVQSNSYTSDARHIGSGSWDNTTRMWDAFTYASIRTSSCNLNHPDFFAKPDMDGWVRDSMGGLLYWVPHECRSSVHSPALMTIPLTSRNRSVFLDFDDIAFGTSWTNIFKSAPSQPFFP